MDSLVQSTLQSVSDHPSVAIFVVFMVTAAEAIAVVGLFIPGTAILLGVGLLVGAGDLPLWPVMGAGTTGAIVGHTVSFWLGRRYQSQLRGAWMFRRWPQVLARTDQFFRHYGPGLLQGIWVRERFASDWLLRQALIPGRLAHTTAGSPRPAPTRR